ncbi:hypothetical protein WR25_11907 [Diploscapter pachys]|uniref:Uncharacterized protein n=1 Tax=Diploscapter pachys TaxID=2018661 RepID=A0A2A2J8Y8_9BILA|nr:hypothetical protein WR25_11907 [Diploscapter pachys]
MSSGIGSGEGSRCASPNVTVYPMSVRQQLALIKQMEQPSPSSSVDGEGGSASVNTPGSSRKRVSRVHKKNDRGETALHVAARRGDDVQCERLIEEGAEVNCADYAGWSALHEAAFHNRFHAAQILIEKGADVNFESADFETPLHDAAAKGFVKIVWLLLKHGADRAKKNKDGKRPIDLVDEEEHPRVYSLLTTNTLPTECPSGAPSSPERGESIGRGGYDSGNETPNAGSSAHAQAPPPPVSAPLPLPIPPSSSTSTSIPSTVPFVPSISLTPPTESIHIPEQKPPTEPEQVVVSPPADVPIPAPAPVPAPSQVPSLPPEVPISVDTTDPLLAMDTGSGQPTPTGAISEPLLTKSEPLIIQTPTASVDISLQNTSSEAEMVETVKEEKKPSSQPSTPTIRIKFSTPSLNDEPKDKEKQPQMQSNSDSAPASMKGSPEEKMQIDEVKTEQKDQQGTDVKALTATVNIQISPITVESEETRRDSSASAVSAPGASTELFESGPLKTMKLNRQMEEEEGMIEGDIGEQKQNVEDEAEEYEDDEMSKDSSSQMNIPSVGSMNALLKQGEEGDECSDDVVTAVRKQRLGLPRGRGARGRPSSRSSTPISTSGERMVARKTVGRGRGSKRGRGNLNYGTRHLEAISFVNAPSSTATDDVFEFRGSPDGLEEDEVLTRPPSPKRAKTERETSSAAGSNSGEADDMNEETGDEDRMKKVPPLRILLPKTPSEEDPEEPRRTRMGIRSGKAGSGLGTSRTGAETQGGQTQEDDKRITRSKVKQGGKVMDDFEGGLMTKKKRREKAESDHTRESSVLATIDEGGGEMSTSMVKIELKEEVVEEENRVGHEILQQNPSTGALSMKRMLANRWLHDLENQQKLPKTSEESRFKNFSIFSGNYKSVRKNKDRSRSVLSDENKTSWPYEIMSDVHKKQWKARRELRQRMAGERIRLRLSFEEDLIRLSRRRNGTTPLMSFARMHAESEICNPLFLDEPPENINLGYSDLALKKQRSRLLGEIHKRSTALYKRHRMEAESLQILQRNSWNFEAAKRHISLTEELVKQCVPRVQVRKIVIRRPGRKRYQLRAAIDIDLLFAEMSVEIQPSAYVLSVLHALKTPANGVVGLLVGTHGPNSIKITNAVPVAHSVTPMAPVVEVALALVSHSNTVVGVYFANQHLKDDSLNAFVKRFAEKVGTMSGKSPLLLQIRNRDLNPSCSSNCLVAYQKDKESDNWKTVKLNHSAKAQTALSMSIQDKLYRQIVDVENHFDKPELDFYNLALNAKVDKLSA